MNRIWVFWLLLIFVTFAGLEFYAFMSGQNTLSKFIRASTVAYPLLPFVDGLLVGGLAVHLWWTR